MKYIGTEHTETFYHTDSLSSEGIVFETEKRIKKLKKQFPDFEFFQTRKEYMDVPQSIESEAGTVAVNRGHFVTVVFRKKVVEEKKYGLLYELRDLLKKYES